MQILILEVWEEPEILYFSKLLNNSQLLIPQRSRDLGQRCWPLNWAVVLPDGGVPSSTASVLGGRGWGESWSRGRRACWLRMQMPNHTALV